MRKSNNPTGRPKKGIQLSDHDLKIIRNLIAAGCSKEGIRTYFKFSNMAFYSELMKKPEVIEMFEEGKELRTTMLQMKQMEVAMEGNVPMLIHLGKNYLDQTEKAQITGNLEVNNTYDPDMIKKIAQAIVNEQH
jgi:hypothetical protein